MPTNDFLPFGTAVGANVMTQADYLALTARSNGFSAGTAASAQLNKAWRQSSIIASMLAQFIADQSGQNAIDDGTTATLEANLLIAIRAAGRQTTVLTDTGTANTYAAANTPALAALPTTSGYSQRVNIANANTGAATYAPDGLAPKPIYGLALQPLQGGELPAGIAVMIYLVQAGVNGGNGAWIIIESLGGALQVAPATKSMHAVQQSQLGNYNSFGYISVSTSMTSAYLGKEYVVQGGAVQTLPPVSVAPAGSTINLIIYTATQIKGNGAELITMISGATSSNTINVNPGEQIQFISNGLSWYIANYATNAQYQLNTAFTTAGTAGALTLAPSPAIQAYSSPLRFRVKFSQNSTGADTINVSGLGAKSIKQYDSTGAKVAAVFAVTQLADVEYDGTDFVLLDQLPAASTGVIGTTRNLKMAVTAASATATLTADEIVLGIALGGAQIKVASFSKTINLATTGAGGMDTGTAPVSGYVAIYVIYNPTTLSSALLAVNATSSAAPSIYGGANMPSGYTYSALVSVWGTNASGQLRVGYQFDRTINAVAISVLNTTAASASFTALNVSAAIPLNATSAFGTAGLNSNAGALNMSIAADNSGVGSGLQQITASAVTNISSNFNVLTPTAQRIYYTFTATGGSAVANIFIGGYTI